MSRRKKDPLRPLTNDERTSLGQLSRSQVAPAVEVARAKILLAVAGGDDYQQAARTAGRRSGDAVSHLVARFNVEGTAALTSHHGGGKPRGYDHAARERVLREARRVPDARGRRHGHLVALNPQGIAPIGTRWPAPGRHLDALAGAPRRRPQLPAHTSCPTGTALRRRKAGPVVVADPDAEPKKTRTAECS